MRKRGPSIGEDKVIRQLIVRKAARARAKALSPERRTEIAREGGKAAAKARGTMSPVTIKRLRDEGYTPETIERMKAEARAKRAKERGERAA